MKNKPQIRKLGQIDLKSFCIPKGNPQGKTRTTLRIGRNSCKERDPQGIQLQNIQTAHAAHYQKYIQTKKKKWAKDQNGYFSEESLQIADRHMK